MVKFELINEVILLEILDQFIKDSCDFICRLLDNSDHFCYQDICHIFNSVRILNKVELKKVNHFN